MSRVQRRAVAGLSVASYAGVERLRQSRRSRRERGDQPISSGAESRHWISPARAEALIAADRRARANRAFTRHGLQQSRAEQRNQHQLHAVQTPVDAAVATTDDRLVPAEDRPQDATSNVR